MDVLLFNTKMHANALLSSCILICCMFPLFAVIGAQSSGPVVRTATGNVRGQVTDIAREFLGIPFAKPPVGSMRWSKPQPPDPWSPGTLNATARQPACPQKYCYKFLPNASCPDISQTSEDCLYLNVWTPLDANITSGYPVMAFLHGGAFKWGSASLPMYDGGKLAMDGHVIVVDIEYRIGLLGFLYTGDGPGGATGNYGILDQRLALQWIQTNINAFGGDPSKVTLFGQSAGAQSVFIHVMSPPSNSLFRAAIVESAPFAVPYRTKDEARLLATKVRELLKCREEDFQCLLNKTVEEVNDAQQEVTFKITGGKLDEYFEPIGPVVDGVDVPMQPMAAARVGKFRKLPLMLGTVTEEGRLFVYGAWKLNLKRTDYEAALAAIHPSHFEEVETEYPPSDVPDLRDELCEVVTDYLFTCATRNVSENILKGGNRSTFLYVFDHATNGTGGWGKDTFCEGHVCHAEELGYIFQNSRVKGTPDEGTLSQLMVLYWSNFAHSMNPNVGPRSPLLRWFPYSPDSKTIMHFKTPTPECITQFRKQQCDFWDTVGYEQ